MTGRRKALIVCMLVLLTAGCGGGDIDRSDLKTIVNRDFNNDKTEEYEAYTDADGKVARHGKYVRWYSRERRTREEIKDLTREGAGGVIHLDDATEAGSKHGYIQRKAAEGMYEDGRKTGVWKEWYPGGRPQSKGAYLNGKTDGKWTTWYNIDAAGDDKRRESEGRCENGRQVGSWKWWYETGKLKRRGSYEGGKKDGTWVYYDETGKEKRKELYEDGKKIK